MTRRCPIHLFVSLILAAPLTAAAAQVEYTFTTLAGSAGSAGSANGVGGAARFNNPEGVAVDGAGNVYVADRENKTIRKITPGGLVSTFAGSAGISAVVDGTGSAARFDRPSGMAVDSAGNLFASDSQTIRRITPGGVVSTLAGSVGNRGNLDGTGSAARFAFPQGVAVDSAGNVYVADWENHTIRKIIPAREVSTFAGLAGRNGSLNGTGNTARFQNPVGLAFDGAGNLYVTDSMNRTVRKITPGGVVSTFAGAAGSFGSTDGPGGTARFGTPIGAAVDGAGNVFVTDQINETIRRISPEGIVSTLAGSVGNGGNANGRGSAARFNRPGGIAVDSAGNLYVADTGNNTIRKGTPEAVGPPSITTQPQSQVVTAGTDATLRVEAFGTTPLAYQWRFKGAALTGQTNATLNLSNAVPQNSGAYAVTVRNGLGSVESQAAQVTVEWQARFDRVASSDFPDLSARAVAVGDFDNDGLEDLFFANSGGVSRLYRNLGSGRFAVLSTNILSGSASGRKSGVWADYDNDGNLDLFVTRLKLAGRNLLFRNRGDGSFEEVGVQAGLGQIGDSYGAAWGDYDRDGFVDLFVANGENQNNFLYRNRGDGTFQQITAGPIVNDGGNSTGASWGDYDGDGWPDLAVSNQLLPDGDGRLFLYRNNRDGTFSRVTENPVVETLGDSWGVSWADTDRDGDLDLLVVNDSGQSDYLLRNNGKNNFTRIEAGSLTRDARDGLAGLWGDYNNDGLLDALVTGFGGGADLLHRGLGGNAFTNATSLGSAATSTGGYGAAWFDMEGDGDLDAVIASSDDSDGTRLGRNTGNNAAWLRVKLEGRVSNRSAIGAVVRVRAVVDGETVTQMRQIEGGSGINSQSSFIAHFGLSDARVVESLRIEWPSGMVTERTNVPVKQLLIIEELPLGTPVVRVNGRFETSNRHEFQTQEPVEIKLQSSFSNAQIFYTLDGSTPDAASTSYTGPFRVTPSVVVRAMAYKEDFTAETLGEPVHLVFVQSYRVTDATPGGGSVVLNPSGGSYLSNSVVTVTATPLAGWTFLRWEGSVTGTNPVATLLVDGPKSVRAVFGTTVTATAVGGAANGTATVQPATGPQPYGTTVRLSANAASGKYFIRWNLVGANVTTLTNSPLDFVVTNASPAFSALFGTLSAGNFALNLQVEGDGSVTRSPALTQYPAGSTVTLTAEPAPGSAFVGWSGDLGGNQPALAVTMNASKNITAVFAEPPRITAQPESQTVEAGSTATIQANATGTPPLRFQWRKDGANLLEATNATYTIANVQTNNVGHYSVVISNSAGSLESVAASLSVSIYTFTTFAGVAGSGSADGTGSEARFFNPGGVTMDRAGNLYVADSVNRTIRKITPAGQVSTLAGKAGAVGNLDGTGSAALFDHPQGIAVDDAGNIYVADRYANAVRKITPGGLVSTLAGLPYNSGSVDGTGSAARFNQPVGLAVDSAGVLYVADDGDSTIRKITPEGVVSTLAGSAGLEGDANGVGSAARFRRPNGVAVDNLGNVYVADSANHVIRKITPGGVVSTVAGLAGTEGGADGSAGEARFSGPTGLFVDVSGNVFVADRSSSVVRRITPAGVVTTLAGSAYANGGADGAGNQARFDHPSGLVVDGGGNVFVADQSNHAIRKITPLGIVSTFAGLVSSGSVDGTGKAARFYGPYGLAVDGAGNVFVADMGNHTIRKITSGGLVSTLAGLAGASSHADGAGNAARFELPRSTAVDGAGNVYVADAQKHIIRKITAEGLVSTLAGSPWVAGSVDGTGSAARFNYPVSVAVDGAGIVYVADGSNHTIRKISPTGAVTTLAGSAEISGSKDGKGNAARFNNPSGVAVDGAGNVFVAETAYEASTIRKITPDGNVSTVAGLPGNAGWQDGNVDEARFYSPIGVAVDGLGNIYVADSGNSVIRKITPGGLVSTLGGVAQSPGSADGPGSGARFDYPSGVAVDKAGNLYVADFNNYAIRKGTQIVVSPQTSALGPRDQSIIFGAPTGRTFGDPPFELIAMASSGLPVALSVLSGPARLTNSTVHFTGAGTVTIRASQSGNASFNAAMPVNQSFTVAAPLTQRFTGNQGVPMTLGLLAANVQGLQYAIQTAPTGGTATLGIGVVTYAPRLSFYGNDAFTYAVSDPVSGIVTPVQVNLTVNAVAPVFWIAQANYDVVEGSNVVNVTIFKNLSREATVDFTTTSGSAGPVVNGVGDYAHTTATLSFGSGETNKVVSIPINNDNAREPDEFFSFQIFGPSSGALGSPAVAQIRIIDNDAATGDLLLTDIRYPNPRPLSVGRLRLDLWPPDSGGLWRFAGQQQWRASGEVVEGLPDGVYAVEFNGAAGGYIQPAPLEISISGGALVTSSIYYIGTTPRTGSLSVNLSPASVANAPIITQRGQWRRKGESVWRDSGFLQSNLNEGPHVIEFKPAEGYAKPPDRTVLVAAKTTLVNFAAYTLAEFAPGLPPSVVHPSSIDLANFPYAFNGQISTEAGQGSGFVVKERVVLTAAHVVYDDSKFDFAKQVRWFFQRYKGFHESKGEKPRGWYVSDSYSSQRKLENTPGMSSPRSKNVDVAALYFTGPAGRGGYGGYLASDADNNEWLVTGASGPRLKMLVGYPIDNIAEADQGKLHATGVAPINFAQVFQRVYKTTEIKSYGGNSGGPLCVEYNGRYYPAAIFLGGSGQLDVRAIDSLVVDLINRAEISGNGGENNTSGGVITFAPVLTDTVTGFGYLTVQMEPAAAVNAGAGWRIVGGNPAFVRSAVANLPLVDGDYNLEFADAAGYSKPPISPVQIFPGTNTTFQARYEPANKTLLTLDLAGGLRLQGNRGATFRVETKTSLDPAQPWQTFATITLTGDTQTVPGFQLQADATRFFRAVLITP